MTSPHRSTKVLLIADRREDASPRDGAGVRRYRLARLRFDARDGVAPERFEHLKRVYE
jgi:hypothetical protein